MPYLTQKAREGNRRRVKRWRDANRDEYNRTARERYAQSVRKVRAEPGELLHAPDVPAAQHTV